MFVIRLKQTAIACVLLCLSTSCSKNRTTEEKLLQMVESEVQFPATLPGVNVVIPIEEYLEGSEYTIVSYTDGVGCTGCRMRLGHWINTMERFKTECDADVRLVMVTNPMDSATLAYDLRRVNFTYPVYYDKADSFRIANALPDEHALQTFLLDSDMKIIAVGNPVYNVEIARLFKAIMNGEDLHAVTEASEHAHSPISLRPSYIQLGGVKPGEQKELLTSIHNTTDSVIRIRKISPSCSCIEATLGVDSLLPGENRFMTIKLHKDSITGHFDRYIDIVTTGCADPAQLRLEGFGVSE